MKLYKLETVGVGKFYVVAEDFTDAETKLKKVLNEGQCGFIDHRKVANITLIEEAISDTRFIGSKRLVL